MKKSWTAQCSYAGYWSITVTVEAETLDEALDKAIETANQSEGWRSSDHCGDTHVDAVCEGADADPWATDTALPVPDRFTEQGEPPIVTITDPAKPGGGIEVTRGRALMRFRRPGAEICQTAFNIDPRSACKIDPPEWHGGGCPGSQ